MTFKEQVLQIIKEHEKEYNPVDNYVTTDELAWLYEEIRLLEDNPWNTGTPADEGDYIVAFRMSDNSVEYGWCNWNNGAWDILFDYDTTDGSCGMIAWQKIEPCNWFDFLFSEGHCDNWREVR